MSRDACGKRNESGSIRGDSTEQPPSPIFLKSSHVVIPGSIFPSVERIHREGRWFSSSFHVTHHYHLSGLQDTLTDPAEKKEVHVKELEILREPHYLCWPKKDIWEWYDKLPRLAGMNYLPQTCGNIVEMWDENSFNPDVIHEELHWAARKLGYNTLRIKIPFVVYEHDPVGLKRRINHFLHIAARNGFAVVLCPLDDCEVSGETSKSGPEPENVPGRCKSRAIGGPGQSLVMDESQWFHIEEYTRWTVRNWGQDKRILLLDLYHEPRNPWVVTKEGTCVIPETEVIEKRTLLLMEKIFQWAREENPCQPLTTSAWHCMSDPLFDYGSTPMVLPRVAHEIHQRAMELSDVISVHASCDPARRCHTLTEIASHGKPILLTEWKVTRHVQSTCDTTFPMHKERKVVSTYQFGLSKL